ncbi:hypothetical protein Plhal304r1_c029g0094631 [Plasmopara halstedii]
MMRIQCISAKHCTTQASLFYSKKVDVYARSDVRITMLQGFRACVRMLCLCETYQGYLLIAFLA